MKGGGSRKRGGLDSGRGWVGGGGSRENKGLGRESEATFPLELGPEFLIPATSESVSRSVVSDSLRPHGL